MTNLHLREAAHKQQFAVPIVIRMLWDVAGLFARPLSLKIESHKRERPSLGRQYPGRKSRPHWSDAYPPVRFGRHPWTGMVAALEGAPYRRQQGGMRQ
jgi:hypothetical protein